MGEGTYGSVYLARDLLDRFDGLSHIVIKVIRDVYPIDTSPENMILYNLWRDEKDGNRVYPREVEIMLMLKDVSKFSQILGHFQGRKRTFIVMELIDNCIDLSEFVYNGHGRCLSD